MTTSHVNLFKSWFKDNHELREPESVDRTVLDLPMAQFFLGVRKPGQQQLAHTSWQYEPQTLVSMQNSIFRYLRDRGY